jgi:hypothetical protein
MRAAFVITVLLSVVLSQAMIAEAQQQSPGAIVERFCSLDAAGKQLNAPGAKGIARELLLTENSWDQPTELIIVKDYSVRTLGGKKDTAEFAVDYRVLGRMDSSLSLTRLQTPYTNEPVEQSEHFSVVLSDTHSELGSDGHLQQIKGDLEWRIKSYPTQPHISIAAAQAYVRLASYRSRDLRAKMNAQKTLSQLQGLYASPLLSGETSAVSAQAL